MERYTTIISVKSVSVPHSGSYWSKRTPAVATVTVKNITSCTTHQFFTGNVHKLSAGEITVDCSTTHICFYLHVAGNYDYKSSVFPTAVSLVTVPAEGLESTALICVVK